MTMYECARITLRNEIYLALLHFLSHPKVTTVFRYIAGCFLIRNLLFKKMYHHVKIDTSHMNIYKTFHLCKKESRIILVTELFMGIRYVIPD